MSRRVTTIRTKTGPALRVARKITPCGVAGFDKGTTIACIPRLAWRDFSRQRGLRTKREQALDSFDIGSAFPRGSVGTSHQPPHAAPHRSSFSVQPPAFSALIGFIGFFRSDQPPLIPQQPTKPNQLRPGFLPLIQLAPCRFG